MAPPFAPGPALIDQGWTYTPPAPGVAQLHRFTRTTDIGGFRARITGVNLGAPVGWIFIYWATTRTGAVLTSPDRHHQFLSSPSLADAAAESWALALAAAADPLTYGRPAGEVIEYDDYAARGEWLARRHPRLFMVPAFRNAFEYQVHHPRWTLTVRVLRSRLRTSADASYLRRGLLAGRAYIAEGRMVLGARVYQHA